jgi:hypothetical protein
VTRTLLAIAALTLFAIGCSSDDLGVAPPPDASAVLEPLDIPAGCNPLAADLDCLLPYPSDHFLIDDEAMPSGARVEHGDAAAPRTTGGAVADPTRRHPADGFSHMPQLLAVFGEAIDDADLPGARNPERSLEGDSPTVIVAASTGERVLHLAELDPRTADPARQALLLRPLRRLDNETRYVVGVRRLAGPDGAPIPTPEGFRRLRDGVAAGDPVLEPLAERYEQEIFGVLEGAGFARDELQLAWDFTTQSFEHVSADMLAIRDAVIAQFEETPPPVTITAVDDDPEIPGIHRRVRGAVEVPLFLEADEPFAPLRRGSEGRPEAGGQAAAEFTILIPTSVHEADEPARLVQYGHGFFGGRDEIERGFVPDFASRAKVVVIAVDWVGMASEDQLPVANTLISSPSDVIGFTDRIHQAMAHQLALTYAARSTLLEEAAVSRDGGDSYFDPDAIYFYGISQGHVLGGTFMALSPHIERAALSVGGGSLPLAMMRSRRFVEFLDLLESLHDDPLDPQKVVSLTTTAFDRVDPLTYAPHVLADTFAGSPPSRRVLMHVGIGDDAVANIASHAHARSLGLSHLVPAPRPVAGLPEVEAPFEGSAMVEFDFGLPEPLPGDIATPSEGDNGVHGGVRELEPAILQVDAFFQPAAPIEHFCDGPCTPE